MLFGEGQHVYARWQIVGTYAGDRLGIPARGRSVAVETTDLAEEPLGRVEDLGAVRLTSSGTDAAPCAPGVSAVAIDPKLIAGSVRSTLTFGVLVAFAATTDGSETAAS